MSWQDRNYPGDENPMRSYGRPGGDWQGIRPSFDNPATWALPMGRFAGIQIRVHLIFLIYIVVELLRQFVGASQDDPNPIGIWHTFATLACLFLIVLVHEFGHCFGCRATGGEANEILMWPLGGLAYCRPPNHWKAHMITVVAGPAVNVAICLAAAPMLGIATGKWLGVALPNPIYPFSGLAYTDSVPLTLLYLINTLSLLLLLFNLLPMFPLDGGRMLQSALWARIGYVRSMRISLRTGFIGALLLAIFGLVISSLMLVLIAVFGALTCWLTHKQVAFTEEMMGHESDDYALSLAYGSESTSTESIAPSRQDKRARRRATREEEEARELDRILEKIASDGMESLTWREKRLLKRATDRKRKRGRHD